MPQSQPHIFLLKRFSLCFRLQPTEISIEFWSKLISGFINAGISFCLKVIEISSPSSKILPRCFRPHKRPSQQVRLTLISSSSWSSYPDSCSLPSNSST
ncbi:unnamed protein product [Blepharisma stoltei]|uniref:Uncharacterized protein n=1 Tax=Blepharisma stoltei TaxID=1481888 RepID=A0AAU9KA00_9CILI|nr:unnamed protein product [Blepharisma stoltei]